MRRARNRPALAVSKRQPAVFASAVQLVKNRTAHRGGPLRASVRSSRLPSYPVIARDGCGAPGWVIAVGTLMVSEVFAAAIIEDNAVVGTEGGAAHAIDL
jgi:hypothetical protein